METSVRALVWWQRPSDRLMGRILGTTFFVQWPLMVLVWSFVSCVSVVANIDIGDALKIASMTALAFGAVLARWRFPKLYHRVTRYARLCRDADILITQQYLGHELVFLASRPIYRLLIRQRCLLAREGWMAGEGHGLWEENSQFIDRKLDVFAQLIKNARPS